MQTTLTTCTACGCACDDIRLSADSGGDVTSAANACNMGAAWFAEPAVEGPSATVDGKATSLDEAVRRAAEILAEARLPLVAGFQHATTEAIRAGVALADQIGACVDWTTSEADAASALALQTVGGVTATLGEVAQRTDVVLVWGADLAATHPRHFERYSLEPTSPWIAGRSDRTLIVLDDHPTATMDEAAQSITIKSAANFESLVVLRALVAGVKLDAAQVKQETGVELDVWQSLVERMKRAKYGAVVYGGQLATQRELVVALTELMADLTAVARWVSVAAGGAGNSTGAANVLTWQTGFPLGVNLAHRYPQYGPDEWTTAGLLERSEVDAAVIVADDLAAKLSKSAAEHLARIPTIALDWRATATMDHAGVAFRTARPGVECAGTTYRVDGVALPMRPCRQVERPTCEEVLNRICQLLQK